jgi:hypothetical protein
VAADAVHPEWIKKVVYACRFVTFLAIDGLLVGCITCFLTVLARVNSFH